MFYDWYLSGMGNISSHTHKTGFCCLSGVRNTSSHTHKTGFWYLSGVRNISSHTHKTGYWCLLGMRNISSHTQKTGSLCLLEFFSKFLTNLPHLRPFIWESPPSGHLTTCLVNGIFGSPRSSYKVSPDLRQV